LKQETNIVSIYHQILFQDILGVSLEQKCKQRRMKHFIFWCPRKLVFCW